jgi:phosphohistidine phosphatase SixA
MWSRRRFVAGAAGLAAEAAFGAPESPVWAVLRGGGVVILMRHASTVPGLGDPPGFRLDDCSTQRNLSAAGLEEARRVGERLRAQRVPIGQVLSSPWCRCRDTARAAFGRYEDWDPLSSFFDFPDREPAYSEHVRKRIASLNIRKPAGNLVMVTHNVNIAALTRLSVGTGEIVVVRPEGCCSVRTIERLNLVAGT